MSLAASHGAEAELVSVPHAGSPTMLPEDGWQKRPGQLISEPLSCKCRDLDSPADLSRQSCHKTTEVGTVSELFVNSGQLRLVTCSCDFPMVSKKRRSV